MTMLSLILFRCTSVSHFNDLAETEERESGDIIPYLELKGGDRVADIGAGGGYYSFKLAQAVGKMGVVYAIDIDHASIGYIREHASKTNTTNLKTIIASYDDSKLESQSVDLVFIRNAYHDFQDRVAYFTRLKTALKPKGRVVIIDYDPAKLGFLRKLFGHALDENTIISEMKQAGYMRIKGYSFLKQQSFNVFISE